MCEASKKSPVCSLELGMFVWSMLGVMGEEIALHRSSAKMLIQSCHFSNRNVLFARELCLQNYENSLKINTE